MNEKTNNDLLDHLPKPFVLEKKLDNDSLEALLKEHSYHLIDQYFIHEKSGTIYKASHATLLSHNNRSELAVVYNPVRIHYDGNTQHIGAPLINIPHTRPYSEFFDGRFTYLQEGDKQ